MEKKRLTGKLATRPTDIVAHEYKKNKPNWLLRGLVGVSLALHTVIFMHVAGIYESKALTYIELTMQGISQPSVRSIPRPRLRPKAPELNDLKKPMVTLNPLPQFKPIQVDPADSNLSDGLMEALAMPQIPDSAGFGIAQWAPGTDFAGGADEFLTANSYLEMVRLKIERHKKYPQAARAKSVEGRVTIQFIITSQGGVRGVTIAKAAQNEALNTAAMEAVEKAAPFPIPPKRFFNGDIPLELTIVFELT
jgi:periplasmic protein TonB